MKKLRRLFYKIFPRYRRIDFKQCSWDEANKLMKREPGWSIAPEDVDNNVTLYPMVAIEKLERITE